MKVVFSEEARQNLLQIGDYIARDSPRNALVFIGQLRAQALSISEMPHRYPLIQRYSGKGIRKCIFRNYLILFQVRAETISILHIVHGARDIEALLAID